MHPAKSVIYFTTASGAGYGLFVWMAVLAWAGFLPANSVFGFVAMALSLGLVISGLLSSTLHLGRPERAWRAFSQWRSSWLSREGIAAILTFIPMSIFAIGWIFLGDNTGAYGIAGLIGAAMSMVTVFTTAMIYASLKTIPAWHNVWTKIAYPVLSLMSGGVLALALCYLFGLTDAGYHIFLFVIGFLTFGLLVKLAYWRHIHNTKPISTAESATGLGRFGKVTLAGSPHGEDNYLLKEMGFKIARKHARKIRIIAIICSFVLPIILMGIGFQMHGIIRSMLMVAGAVCCLIGLCFERWMFFAEAKHVVTLYYGEEKV